MIQVDTGWVYDLAKFTGALGVISGFFLLPIWKKLKKQVDRVKETERKAEENERMLKAHEQAIQESRADREQIRTDISNLQSMTLALLRVELLKMCEVLIAKGWVTCDELEELDMLYKPYKKNDGNGLGRIMYEKVKALPIKVITN